jgi:outer membrane protein TolC/ABC-type uncharacterized transport system substrate-binding protein
MIRISLLPRRFVSLLLLILLLTVANAIAQSESKSPVVIGWVVDGPWERNSEIGDAFQTEITDLVGREFDVQFPADKLLTADWHGATVDSLINQLLADTSVDIVIGMGVIASQNIARRRDLPKPAFAPFIINSAVQSIPRENGASGVHNLSYLTSPWRLDRDFRVFRELVPITHLAVLTCGPLMQADQELISLCWSAGDSIDVSTDVIQVFFSADSALAQISEDVDAVYISALMQLPAPELDKLIAGINERKLPSFGLFGRDYVEKGVMAGVAAPTNFGRIARRIAVYIQRTLLGDDPATFKVFVPTGRDLAINMATVRSIGVWPPWEMITEAELIDIRRTDVDRVLTLHATVKQAVDVNLDYMVNQYEVSAGQKEVSKARSNLLPQVDASISGLIIDKDRAEASLGSQAERTVSGSIEGTQLIFSEAAWANLSVQNKLQMQREFERNALRLNIAHDAAVAYLNVLRAKTFESIQKENLRLTRSNLELAQTRQQIGIARPAEVLRWESQIATNRKNVIEANSQRNLAEIELNRILNRPLEEPFRTAETSLEDSTLLTAGGQLFEYMKDPGSFKTLRRYIAELALENSPEIQQLDAGIDARSRLLTSYKRRFFAPTIGLNGKVSKRFDESGAGSGSFLSPAAQQNLGLSFPMADDVDWSLALNASLPLFEGGKRIADVAQSRDQLHALKTQRAAIAERIEQRARSAMHTAGASFAGIRLSRDAADAARENLNLVIDAYSAGAVSIIDLIDAQNAALVADEVAANAVFDFLIDMAEVERSVGFSYTLMSTDERTAVFERLRQYMATNR